jgi:hypothetical protein
MIARACIYTIHYTDNGKHLAKYLKDIYNHYVTRGGDTINYDRFKYLYNRKRIDNLDSVLKIECYDFNEFLKPKFELIKIASEVKSDKECKTLSPYTKNKIFAIAQKEYNA